MKTKDYRFKDAYRYAFEEVFPTIFLPVKKLLEAISAELVPENRSILSASSCVMLLMGIKTMTKFYSFGTDTRDDLESFVQRFFPSAYRWQFKKLYRAYEQGILYYLGQKHGGGLPVSFAAVAGTPVFSETAQGVFEVNVEALFEDFVNAVERFKSTLQDDAAEEDRVSFFYCYEKIKSACLREWK